MIIPDRKKAATIIISHMMDPQMREKEHEKEEKSEDEECDALGKELIDALASKDAMAVYDAVKAIFLKADSEPHKEGEHEDEEEEEFEEEY